MNKNSKYIVMQPPYTLDKWKDGAAQVRSEKELQELVNYIPYDGNIITREGILTLTHTPQTTDVFNPKTDTRCYMVLDFEDGDELGKNVGVPKTTAQLIYLSPYGYTAKTGSSTWTLDCKEGTHALWVTNNTSENTAAGSGPHYYGLNRPGSWGNLRSWVAGAECASTVNEWMITGWFKITSSKSNAWLHLTGEYGVDAGIEITLTPCATTMTFESTYYSQVHGTLKRNNATASVAFNQWHFFGTWCSNSSHSTALYVYNDVTKVEIYTATTGLSAFTNFNRTTSRQTIGGGYDSDGVGAYTDDSEAFPGRIDYMTFWGELPASDADKLLLIKQIRDLHKA